MTELLGVQESLVGNLIVSVLVKIFPLLDCEGSLSCSQNALTGLHAEAAGPILCSTSYIIM
jgi:hypothetical protein